MGWSIVQTTLRAEQNIGIINGIIALLIGGLPVLAMMAQSFIVEDHFSFSNYSKLFSSRNELILLQNSLLLAITVTVISGTIGISLGLVLAKTSVPFRTFFSAMLILPLLLPPYFIANGWFYVFSREGLIGQLFGIQTSAYTSKLLFGFPGCALTLSTSFAPIPMLLTISYLHYVPRSLEEVAQLSKPWISILRKITLPMIRSGIYLSLVLVFLMSIAEVGVPMFLRYPVYAVQSLTQFAAFYDFGAATAAAVPLTIIAFVLLLTVGMYFKGKHYLAQQAEKPMLILLDRKGQVIVLTCISICTWLVIFPLLMIVINSGNYSAAFQKIADSLIRTFIYAAVSATLLSIFGFLSGFLQHQKVSFSKWFEAGWLFLFALPGPVLGIALIILWNRPGLSLVYGSGVILILGFLSQFMLLGSRIINIVLSLIPQSLEEAAKVFGAGWFRRTMRITLPLATYGLIAAWLVSFLFCIRDNGLSMLLYPPGKELVSTRIFTLMANSPPKLIATCLTILIATVFIPYFILTLVLKKRLYVQ
ncbi:ABC transporter permease subunit [bacterium]|nr:ABC transporter permease subunit [bacterium]